MKYETHHYFRSTPDRHRPPTPPARVALVGYLHPAPLPDFVGQRRRANAGCHRPPARLHGHHRAERHPHLRGGRTHLPEGEIFASPQRPPSARRRLRRTLASLAAPESTLLRPTPQHLDVGPGGPG